MTVGVGQSSPVDSFPEHVRSRAVDGLRSLDAAHRADTYVVSFLVYDDDDDPRCPTLLVGTNTEHQVQLSTAPPAGFVKPNPWWTPTDEHASFLEHVRSAVAGATEPRRERRRRQYQRLLRRAFDPSTCPRAMPTGAPTPKP